jgi:hypothetical protein
MKTTVEISDDLAREIKALAAADRTTVRALIEQGLRLLLAGRRKQRRFKLRDASVEGRGLQPGISEGDWDRIQDLIYRGRGT